MRRLCVYCGSNPGADPAFAQAARELGRLLVARGTGLVYGGGAVGLMGVLADTVLAGGGEVIGVIPEDLVTQEVAHEGLSGRHVVRSMHQRKRLMCELGEGFVALPGGFGTLDEIMEMLTWRQLGYHRKPCGLLNVSGYYDHLLRFLEHAVAQRLVMARHRALLHVAEAPAALLAALLDEAPGAGPARRLERA